MQNIKSNEDKRKLALELHKQGLTQTEIGQQLGIKQSWVSTLLTSMGVRSRPRRIGKNLIVDFVKDYKNGKSLEEIAALYCVSNNAVRIHLKSNGVKFPKGKLDHDEIELMMGLSEKGKDALTIAKDIKRDRRTVRKYLNERGNNNDDKI